MSKTAQRFALTREYRDDSSSGSGSGSGYLKEGGDRREHGDDGVDVGVAGEDLPDLIAAKPHQHAADHLARGYTSTCKACDV